MSTLKSTLAQRRKHDEGFTLIELMVVVMIIAVLLAIAIPTFLGSQNKAKDRAAQSSLRNALTAAKTIYTDGSDYKLADTVALKAGEPSLSFVTTASTDAKTVSLVATATATTSIFYAASKSASGTCYMIKDDVTLTTGTGTTYSKGTPASCDGATAALPATVYTTNGW
jgi:type IV pilus assembly protein PilA